MPTSTNVNEAPSAQDRTRGFTEDRTKAATGLLIAAGFIFLVVVMGYLDSLIGPAELQSVGPLVGP